MDCAPTTLADVARRLTAAGCVAADEEATELLAAAGGDAGRLASLVGRRVTGEPLAWVTGRVRFCGAEVAVEPGVYVPRWQSEAIAERAAELLPAAGRAVDLATGSGALAVVLALRRPGAAVLGTELDPLAVRCARRNGVTVCRGDLFESVPAHWTATVDVVTGVVPYVPTGQLQYLPRDVLAFEPAGALDGGADGLAVARRAVCESRRWLRPGGHLLLEVGADQPEALAPDLRRAGFTGVAVMVDGDGDPRAVEATAGWEGH